MTGEDGNGSRVGIAVTPGPHTGWVHLTLSDDLTQTELKITLNHTDALALASRIAETSHRKGMFT
jgi:hypothetical protein